MKPRRASARARRAAAMPPPTSCTPCARCRSGRARTSPEAPALLAGDPEAPAALRRAGLARLALLLGRRRGRPLARRRGARRCLLAGGRGAGGGGLVPAGALRRLADEPRVGHLEVRHGSAHLAELRPEIGLDERQQRARGLDRLAELVEVDLALVAGDEAGAQRADVEQRAEGPGDDILDAYPAQLLAVGAQLLLGRRALEVFGRRFLLAHAALASWTWVSGVSFTAAA